MDAGRYNDRALGGHQGEHMNFQELRTINVNEHIEKKNGLSYLSWSWAVDVLLQHDPMATWEFPEPAVYGESVMVYCNVHAFGKTMRMHLPVMDYKNQALKNPNSVDINKAMMRCLAKCIACFGIGLYIYSGEDLPDDGGPSANPLDQIAPPKPAQKSAQKAETPAGKPTGTFALHIPGKEDQVYQTLEEWQNGYEELGARIMASKLSPEQKLEKLDALAHTNKAMMQTIPATSRISHTASYAKRKAELGI